MAPAEVAAEARPSSAARLRGLLKRYRWFVICVIAPVAIVATYLYAMASDQYISEAHFLVKTQGGSTTSSGGIGAALGFGGGASMGQGEAMSVSDYLTSHDVVATLRAKVDLVGIFRRSEADALSKLTTDTPTPEALLKYYRKQVDVYFDTDNGITTMTVRTFRPKDSYALAKALLALGEQRVNEMNVRGFRDAVALSERQLHETESAIGTIQAQITRFRQSERDVDPEGSAAAQISLVSKLSQELSAARSQLQTTQRLIGNDNPQIEALRQQERSLETQLAAQSGRLTGSTSAIAQGLGGYEQLRVKQENLAKRYDAATAAYESARQLAVRQQLYVVRVVDPNMPVKSEYPKRALTLLTLFAILMVAYGIGWLIAAGVREHAV